MLIDAERLQASAYADAHEALMKNKAAITPTMQLQL